MTGWEIAGLLGWTALVAVTVTALRQRAALVAARRKLAAADRDRRDLTASRQRLLIARELHDVVAHNLSLINVQSGMALQQVENKSTKAVGTVAAIKSTSRDALEDVQALRQAIQEVETEPEPTIAAPGSAPRRDDNGIRLRRGSFGRHDDPAPDDRDQRKRNERRREPATADAARSTESAPPAQREPEPTMSDPDTLVRKPRQSGLTVQTRILGTPGPLPKAIDDAAVQVVEESLNNVMQHAAGAEATVTIRYTADSVDLTVDNARPTTKSERTGPTRGMGLITLREHIHALGGALTAGPKPSGGFRVAARVPSRPLSVAVDPDASPGPRRNPREPAASRPAKLPPRPDADRREDVAQHTVTTTRTPET